MATPFRPVVLALLCSAIAGAAWAGHVDVSFDAKASYTDAGVTPRQREQRLAALAEHLKALGERRLPDDRWLSIELLDLDLAGTTRPVGRAATDLRIVRGGADGPHIELRYSLRDGSRTIAAGREALFDAGLPRLDPSRDSGGGDPLRQEKLLLDRWFEERFGAGSPGPR